jgi:TetR/AcrR family transcriptional repressor of nem operon
VFDRFIDQTDVPHGNWGCFIVNTALELAAHDSEIADLVNAAQDDIEAFFLAMIRKGQQAGEFAVGKDATVLARQALASMLGMLVMIRSRPDAETLRAIRDGVLKSLI